jgi:hypothetical protein
MVFAWLIVLELDLASVDAWLHFTAKVVPEAEPRKVNIVGTITLLQTILTFVQAINTTYCATVIDRGPWGASGEVMRVVQVGLTGDLAVARQPILHYFCTSNRRHLLRL